MLDLKLIRDNPEFVKAGVRKKGRDPGLVDIVLGIDRRRREQLQEVEHLRAEQNRASGEIAKLQGADKAARITQMRDVSTRLKILEPVLKEVEEELTRALLDLPNLPHESVPPGSDERENVPLRYWGDPPQFDFSPLDHLELGTRLGIIDVERAAKVSGARFYYLRGAGVLLEQAVLRFGLELLVAEGFTPVITPFVVRPEIITGAWGGADLDVQQVYRLEGEQLALIGTSEQPLAGMYSDETFDEGQLPM
ncbi:MAG: serine--tRNA ligase, partial [bacterium]